MTNGDRVIVTGRLWQRSFDTREGDKRTVIELGVVSDSQYPGDWHPPGWGPGARKEVIVGTPRPRIRVVADCGISRSAGVAVAVTDGLARRRPTASSPRLGRIMLTKLIKPRGGGPAWMS